ncbi:MAG TPA: trypsin-like peptidase domain-containing protein [Pirellulaceae bacterium]|nr:trypsin-like peptidase domain-containing protein [Pirellulaceae bacterium]HMO93356.1 trypsin-like peptidase domain-containing protein [Pirellulaceae bacterium]HMP70127.1 trypsin-like peptidase domain-containing protein [Pirellulaceae bacterium]
MIDSPGKLDTFLPQVFRQSLILLLIDLMCGFAGLSAACQEEDTALVKGLLATPKVVRRAVERVEPSIVTIESFGGVSTKAGQIGGIRRQGEGNTTGLIISPDGYVITSLFNFVQQPQRITVKTSDGVRYIAELRGRDASRNICILKIVGVDNLPVPDFLHEADVRVGQFAISAGVGFGDANVAISTGIISAKNRVGGRAIQTDANISPANYGGPLLDIEGRVIGICVPLSPGNETATAGVEWYDSGIGFAISVADNQELIARLKRGESFEPGFVGIVCAYQDDVVGASITQVVENSPASKAGLQVGDILTQIHEFPITDQLSLTRTLARYSLGDTIILTIRRDPLKNSGKDDAPATTGGGDSNSDTKSVDNPEAKASGGVEVPISDEEQPKNLQEPDAQGSSASKTVEQSPMSDWVELKLELVLGKRPKQDGK